ncbi:DUF3293 domain-containing protein [Lacimicrobium alkaliphilum]|uniref:DUF3293 domain-containing protein n=1 Tax=Lacimicrobium alkaliphilum TaxID=1526571 RepID=A0A0U2QJ27_9ALTE|nr:DUF3293 domain-containing protein [Lacimicrobium alkaliphilum]ALS96987.1 hypothetical protein AT746_00965 [Lacimicrobium alkaliphilum]
MTENTDSCAIRQLWQHYSETVFLPEQPLPDWPQAGIVTACNPRGKVLSDNENAALNDKLSNHLHRLSLPYIRLSGCSPDLRHREPSLLVSCTQDQAMSLAGEFKQNAFFWIENDELYLCPCLLQGMPTRSLGHFAERLIHR